MARLAPAQYLLRLRPEELRAARRAARAASLPLSLWLRGLLCRAVNLPGPEPEEATPGRKRSMKNS